MQERKRMRWCLHIKGMEERKHEEVRSKVIQILCKIAPNMDMKMGEAVDVLHRLGIKMDKKNRNVIVLFTQRRVNEEIWRRSKGSAVCKGVGSNFAEILPREDLVDRKKLWPQIDQARRAGKIGFMFKPVGFIKGGPISATG